MPKETSNKSEKYIMCQVMTSVMRRNGVMRRNCELSQGTGSRRDDTESMLWSKIASTMRQI